MKTAIFRLPFFHLGRKDNSFLWSETSFRIFQGAITLMNLFLVIQIFIKDIAGYDVVYLR
ncbi:hypothetical protein EB354_14195 [Chryseobacterium balustinum]|nr:hypothetical protein EB354_14195 [Chryseobacterium balustinum]